MRAAGPGPLRGPGTAKALLQSSLSEQPTKIRDEWADQVCGREEMSLRRGSHLCSMACLLSQVASHPRSQAHWHLRSLLQPHPRGRECMRLFPTPPPQFADSIHPPPLLGLPVYVVTWFHYLFLALILEAFILLGFGRVSTASFWALKRSLYKPGLHLKVLNHMAFSNILQVFFFFFNESSYLFPSTSSGKVFERKRSFLSKEWLAL